MGLEKGKDSYINLSTCQYHLMPEYGRILRNAVIFVVVYNPKNKSVIVREILSDLLC
jgi:hypothetical protein